MRASIPASNATRASSAATKSISPFIARRVISANARADAEDHGQFVEHLVFDDRRFEIGDEQPLAPPGGRLDQDIDRGVAANNVARGAVDRRRVRGIDNEIAGLARREPDRFGLDRQRLGDRGGEAGKAANRQRRRSR